MSHCSRIRRPSSSLPSKSVDLRNEKSAAQRLIPESQLLFSAELAAAVGLAEAVLLQQIKGLYLHQPSTRRDGLAWLHISRAYLQQLLPFWDAAELQAVCDSLESLGLIVIDRKIAAQDSLLLAINDHDRDHT